MNGSGYDRANSAPQIVEEAAEMGPSAVKFRMVAAVFRAVVGNHFSGLFFRLRLATGRPNELDCLFELGFGGCVLLAASTFAACHVLFSNRAEYAQAYWPLGAIFGVVRTASILDGLI
jgi:hypothetical protein